MTRSVVLFALAAATVAAPATAQAAAAAEGQSARDRKQKLVFVQTNEPTGNHIVVYDRSGDGTLTQAGTYATGGNGGVALPGTESDRLASQGSLVYVAENSLLLALNAGSDTVSAFRVQGDRLTLQDVVPSGGQFPANIAVSDQLVYVLNSGGTGILQGFRIEGQKLRPIPDSARTLGLANADPPFFLTAPGQAGFTPDGRQLLATTKASGSRIDVFGVGPDGRLSDAPVANPSATPVPFAFTFGPQGRLVDGEAGASSVTTYAINSDGSLGDPRSQGDGQVALCWITRVQGFYYVSNTGSNTLSSFTIGPDGQPTLLAPVAAHTDAGPIDLAASGHSLYAETGVTGALDEFQVNGDGSLAALGTATGLPPGREGIAAS